MNWFKNGRLLFTTGGCEGAHHEGEPGSSLDVLDLVCPCYELCKNVRTQQKEYIVAQSGRCATMPWMASKQSCSTRWKVQGATTGSWSGLCQFEWEKYWRTPWLDTCLKKHQNTVSSQGSDNLRQDGLEVVHTKLS